MMNQKMLDVLQKHIDYMTEKYNDDLILTYGTAHIVYDDYNLDNHSIEFSKEYTQRFIDNSDDSGNPAYFSYYLPETCQEILQDTLRLLNELLEIPEDDRYVWEEDDFATSELVPATVETFGRVVDVIVDQLTGDNRVVIYKILGTTPQDAYLDILRVWKNVTLTSLCRVVSYLEKSGGITKGDKEKMDIYIQERIDAQNN